MTVLKISLKRLPITFCSPKITRFSLQRFYSQKVLGLHKGSDAVFQPSIGILARADREFEFLGPRTTLQGSAKKLDDAPKLKLPEVSCYLSYCYGAFWGLLWISSDGDDRRSFENSGIFWRKWPAYPTSNLSIFPFIEV